MFIPLITDVALLHHTCCLILSKQLFIYSYLCSVRKLALQILQTRPSWMHKHECTSHKINHPPFPSPFLILYLKIWWYLYCLHMDKGVTDKTEHVEKLPKYWRAFLQGAAVYAWKDVRFALSGPRNKHSGVSSCFIPLSPQTSSKRKTRGRKTVQELVWFLLIELTRVHFNWIN